MKMHLKVLNFILDNTDPVARSSTCQQQGKDIWTTQPSGVFSRVTKHLGEGADNPSAFLPSHQLLEELHSHR